MRWFWIDCFTELVAESHAVAIKNVSLSEPHVVDYVPSFGHLSQSFVIEGVAQTGGLLVGQSSDFKARVVLAKVSKAKFYRIALPGDQLTYRVEIQSLQNDGAIISATSHIGDCLQGEFDLMFAYLDDRFEGVEMFEPANFLRLLRSLRLFHVGRDKEGNPLEIPEHMLQAEKRHGIPSC